MRNLPSYRRTTLLIIALGLVIAACGGDAGTETTSSSATSEAPATTSEPPDTTEAPPTSEAASASTLTRIQEARYVRIGFTNARPFGYGGAPGELLGVDPDVERAIWGDIEVEGILGPFGSLIPAVNADRIDATASMFITPERCGQVAFTNPHYAIGQAMLVKAGNPQDIHSYDDVAANPNARLGLVAGGVENDYAAAAGVPEGQITVFQDAAAALAGLQADRVDAIALTSGGITALLEDADDPNLERATPFQGPADEEGREIKGYSGFALRPGDTELLEFMNGRVEELRASGDLLAILESYGLSESEAVASGERTVEELCAG